MLKHGPYKAGLAGYQLEHKLLNPKDKEKLEEFRKGLNDRKSSVKNSEVAELELNISD